MLHTHVDAKRIACALTVILLGLGGCAEGPKRVETGKPQQLVFPAPPDEPRFLFERSIYSSGDVVEREKGAALRQILTGEAERGGEGVAKPHGVAVRRGRVYVSDSVAASVKVFDIPGKRFFSIGQEEPGQLLQPLGLYTDNAGNVYVVDATSRLVKVYDRDGKYLRQFGGRQWFSRPSGVGVDAKGERAYVVDSGGVERNDEHRVRVFDAASGKHLFDFGRRGTDDGQFNLARDAAVAANGDVYVIDGGNFRIQVFNRDGKYLRSFGQVGRLPGNFARPREIAVDREGNVYVTDAAFGNFQIFDDKGAVLMHVGTRSERDLPARYMLPAGIAVDDDGRVYMADQFFRKIDVYRPVTLKAGEGFVPGSGTTNNAKSAAPR